MATFVDRWVPSATLAEGGEPLRRMRVAVALTWLGVVLVPVMAVEYLQRGRIVLAVALGAAVLGFFAVLWLVRTRGWSALAGHTLAGLLSITLVEGKGLYDPPILGPLVFPVIVTFVSGRRGGWVWCGLSIAAFVWQAGLTPGDPAANRAWLIGLCLITLSLTSMTHVFEVLRERSFIVQERARKEAQAAAEAKSRFLANMSHEIRTPMNGVLGMLGILLDTPLRDDQQSYARTAHSSGLALLEIIDDILDFSKIGAGKMTLEAEAFDLRVLIEDVLESIAPPASHEDVELVASFVPGTPTRVVGDQKRIRQILINLVGNAIKFTDQGHVRVLVEERRVGDGPPRFRCSVEDTGIGIPPDQHAKVFAMFEQVDGSSTRERAGTGLGLAIVSELVQLMKGECGLSSEPGEGSTFWFELPLPLATDDAVVVRGRVPSWGHRMAVEGEGSTRRSMRVLVVEDNEVNQRVVQRLLSTLGCTVELAGDGHEAVERVAEELYDLVLMDVQMPRMDGLQATARIRRQEQEGGRRVPIVAVTAHALPEDRERCLAAGMDGYITKPIRRSELLRELRAHGLDASVPAIDPILIAPRPRPSAASLRIP